MTQWILAGDEAGNWDTLHDLNENASVGVALVFGPVCVWRKALEQQIKGGKALEVFNQPVHPELPGSRYHIMDIRKRNPNIRKKAEETVRSHLAWLLEKSGLGVMTLRGTVNSMREHGYFISQDPALSRGRCYARLMALLLPFFQDGTLLLPYLSLRSEPRCDDKRRSDEPKRLLFRQLTEDVSIQRQAVASCLTDLPKTQLDVSYEKLKLVLNMTFGRRAAQAGQAMLAIADLACILSKPASGRTIQLQHPDDHYPALGVYNFSDLPWEAPHA